MFRISTPNLLMWITCVLRNRKIRVYDVTPTPVVFYMDSHFFLYVCHPVVVPL